MFAPLKYSSSSIKLLILYDVFAFVGLQYILIWYNFYVNNKIIIEFGFHAISRIIKASVSVICLSLRLRQITPTSA